MAITEALPGVAVTVVTNGVELQEYLDDEVIDDEESATRYIEATEGQSFIMRYHVPRGTEFLGDTLSLRLYIDGELVHTKLLYRERVLQGDITATALGVRCSANTRKEFRFATIRADEDGDRNALPAAKLKDLGTICVQARHVKKLQARQHSSYRSVNNVHALGVVSEKALKGSSVSHSISLGNVVAAKPQDSHGWITAPVDPSKKVAATFTFRYRSKDALRSMLILPPSRQPTPARSPSPPSLTGRDPKSLSQAEVAEMQKRLQEFENQSKSKVMIKREQNENSPPRRKARKSGEVTVIELDDDGDIVSETSMRKSETPDATQLVDID